MLYALTPLTTVRELLITHLVKDHNYEFSTSGLDFDELHHQHLEAHGVKRDPDWRSGPPQNTVVARNNAGDSVAIWHQLVALTPRADSIEAKDHFVLIYEVLSALSFESSSEIRNALEQAINTQSLDPLLEIVDADEIDLAMPSLPVASALLRAAQLGSSDGGTDRLASIRESASDVVLAFSYEDRAFGVLYDRGAVDAGWVMTNESLNNSLDELLRHADALLGE